MPTGIYERSHIHYEILAKARMFSTTPEALKKRTRTAKKNGLIGKSITGKKHSIETIEKRRNSLLKINRWGKNNPYWKGGITPLIRRIRSSRHYGEWRKKVFVRDDYICQFCFKRGGFLNADHIKRFSEIIRENLVDSMENAINCKQLWDISNGRTLCYPCHKTTEGFANRRLKKK